MTLGERAARCKGWRWKMGILVHWPNGDVDRITERTFGLAPGGEPDLTDPATLGCLLALVRQAWGDPALSPYYHEWSDGTSGWSVTCDHESAAVTGALHATEAEALVAALEAAP